MKSEMKHCAGCGAPNPARLSACYACGRLLDQAAPPPVKTYPCRACQSPVPFAAPVCPHCGLAVQASVATESAVRGMAVDELSRVSEALQKSLSVGSIGDWEIEPLPDGTTRLTRGVWGRLTRAGATGWEENLALVVLLVGALFSYALSCPKNAPPKPGWLVVTGVCGVLLLLLLIWMFFSREQLRVGRSVLEWRRTLGGLQRVKRWEGEQAGSFRLGHYEVSGRYGRRAYRVLRVSGRSGTCVLDSHEVPVDYGALESFLVGHAGSQPLLPTAGDEAAALGRFLAHITGWSLLGH